MDNSELKIIETVKKGKYQAFALLYDAYIDRIYRFIYFKTHHKEIAQDLTSDTFIKALEKIQSFDQNKAAFSTWLYQIAKNTVIDHWRTLKATSNVDDIWDLPSDSNVLRDADMSQRINKVKKYLKYLKPQQREIVIMRVWQDLPYKEIAAILGKSESSCKMMFLRTVTSLRKEMPHSLLLFLLVYFM